MPFRQVEVTSSLCSCTRPAPPAKICLRLRRDRRKKGHDVAEVAQHAQNIKAVDHDVAEVAREKQRVAEIKLSSKFITMHGQLAPVR